MNVEDYTIGHKDPNPHKMRIDRVGGSKEEKMKEASFLTSKDSRGAQKKKFKVETTKLRDAEEAPFV